MATLKNLSNYELSDNSLQEIETNLPQDCDYAYINSSPTDGNMGQLFDVYNEDCAYIFSIDVESNVVYSN